MTTASKSSENPLSGDIHKPLDMAKVHLGWQTGREQNYWIPPADIEGEIPRELRGTLLRNGPGISEVYGNKLVHREFTVLYLFHDITQSSATQRGCTVALIFCFFSH